MWARMSLITEKARGETRDGGARDREGEGEEGKGVGRKVVLRTTTPVQVT